MCRKVSCFGLTIAAWFALTLAPTMATASPVLTYPKGTRLATGSLLQITNIGVAVFTESEWRLECPTAHVKGKLVTNTGTAVEIELSSFEMSGLGAGEDCRQDRNKEGSTEIGASVHVTYSGLPWCFRATSQMSADSFDIKAAHCGEIVKNNVTLVFNYTGLKECKYEISSIQGTFTTEATGDAILTMKPELKGEASNSFLCQSSMPSETAMTLERDSLLAEPVYFS